MLFNSCHQPLNGYYLGALLFIFATRSPFLITFVGVNLDAGNELHEKFRSGLGAEQIKEWSEKWSVLFIPLFSREQLIEV